MVMCVDVTAQVTSELQRRMRSGIWHYCLKKQKEHSIRPVSSALFSYRYNSFKVDHLEPWARWSYARRPVSACHQENTIERHRYGGARMSFEEELFLVPERPACSKITMTGHIYRYVILEQDVCLFRAAIGAEFLFMDDNARPHRASIVAGECLQSEDITRMDWPAYCGLNQ
ncbi:transposable element Tcb1 transposase [Trichonephila clavipes]|nr:transposable element Tcb1 transposase [Trichonephila clavipes]